MSYPAGVKCYHNLPAVRKTSQTLANPDREFYRCPKDRDDKSACTFFKWVDQLMPLAESPARATLPMPSTPRPSQRDRAMNDASALFKTPAAPTSPLTTLSSPARGKRLRDIQDALSSPSQSSTAQIEADLLDNEEMSSSPSSSSSRTSLPYHPSGAPSSPKRARTASRQESAVDRVNGSTSILTPPPSSQRIRITSVGSNAIGTETPTRGSAVARGRGEWEDVKNDEDDPFHEPPASMRPLSGNLPRELAASGSGGLPHSESAGPSAESLTAIITSLTSVQRQMQKLERKRMAAEKSSEAKTMRIAELERELQSLKLQNRIQEDTIESLKARIRL